MPESKLLKETPACGALQAHYEKIKDIHLRQLFLEDASRGMRFTAEGAGLSWTSPKTGLQFDLLVQLARERGVAERRDAMFGGEEINVT
jgi:glucose-6-phosphate isomerase